MEGGAFVVERLAFGTNTLFSCAKSAEVLGSLGDRPTEEPCRNAYITVSCRVRRHGLNDRNEVEALPHYNTTLELAIDLWNGKMLELM